MKKLQVIAIIIAAFFIVGLYSLPRVVVDSDESGSELQGSQQDSQAVGEIHDAAIEGEERLSLDSFKNEFAEAPSESAVEVAGKIAEIYVQAGKYDSAAYYLDLAADRQPNSDSWEKAGSAYYEAYTFALNEQKMAYLAEKSRTYLGRVLEVDPKRLDLKTKVAMTYVSSPNPMQGITMLREVLEEDPSNAEGLFNMGVLSMQSGQYKKAAERFEELVKYHPDHIQGQFYLGVSYFESKQNNKATKQFQTIKDMTDDPMILTSVESYLGRL